MTLSLNASHLRRPIVPIIATTILGALTVLITWKGPFAPDAGDNLDGTPPAQLSISTTELALAPIWDGATFERRIHVANNGQEAITIADFRAACDCVAIHPKSATIAAGQDRQFTLSFDIAEGSTPRRFRQRIFPTLQATGLTSPTWDLTGQIIPLVECSPRWLDVEPKLSRTNTQGMSITPNVAVTSLLVNNDDPRIIAKLERDNDGHYYLSAEYVGPRGAESFWTVVPLTARLTNGETVALRGVDVFCRTSEVEATPNEVLFGLVNYGDQLSRTIELRSSSNSKFSILTVRAPKGVSTRLTQNHESSWALGISIRAMVIGQWTGRVTVEFELSDHGVYEVNIPIKYFTAS
jgi:hypothetical protein